MTGLRPSWITRRIVSKKIAGGAIALAVGLVAYYEGYVPKTYVDPIGISTSCYGHVGPENTPGRRFTEGECRALLEGDLAAANAIVRRCITVPMQPYQEAALTSFAFNVGGGKQGVKDGLCVLKNGNQPRVRRFANAGRWAEACASLESWVTAGGIKLRGLVKRRTSERRMCETGSWG